MRRFDLPATIALVPCLFVAAPIARAQPGDTSSTRYWLCQSSTIPPAYVNSVFLKAVHYTVQTAFRNELENSFADFLARKYGYTGRASCLGVGTRIQTEGYRTDRLTTLRAHRIELVETDWTPSALTAPPPAPGEPTDPGMKYWVVCYVNGADIHADRFRQPVYFSGAVPVPLGSSTDYRDVATAFAQFVANRLPAGMTARANCVEIRTHAEALRRIKELEPGTKFAPGEGPLVDCTRGDCVMTNWTSMPASAATDTSKRPVVAVTAAPGASRPTAPNVTTQPPTRAAPAPVPPKPAPPAAGARPAAVAAAPATETLYAVCWGQSERPPNPTAYFSVPFDGTGKNTAAWAKAYRAALDTRYGTASRGPLRCHTSKSLAEAQQDLQKTMDALRPAHRIIETGWKYR